MELSILSNATHRTSRLGPDLLPQRRRGLDHRQQPDRQHHDRALGLDDLYGRLRGNTFVVTMNVSTLGGANNVAVTVTSIEKT